MHTSFNTLKAVALLIILGIIWGSGYSLAKFAMTNGVSPLGYSLWQSLGPAVILAFFLLAHLQVIIIKYQALALFLNLRISWNSHPQYQYVFHRR